jgi:hypothetical protein
LFSDDATALIHHLFRGLPRAVNNLGVQSIVAAYATGKTIVDESSTQAAITDVTANDDQHDAVNTRPRRQPPAGPRHTRTSPASTASPSCPSSASANTGASGMVTEQCRQQD